MRVLSWKLELESSLGDYDLPYSASSTYITLNFLLSLSCLVKVKQEGEEILRIGCYSASKTLSSAFYQI